MSVINPHRCCPLCGDSKITEFTRNDDDAFYHCESQGHEFDSNDTPWDPHEDDWPAAIDDLPGTPLAAAAASRQPPPSRPKWTDTQRIELARYIQTATEKQLDIRLTTHRASVLAVALLTGGWHR